MDRTRARPPGAPPSWAPPHGEPVPPPALPRRDWRWWVGLVGRVLVATGLLLIAFVGYQLWGTGIQQAQAQSRLEDEFERLLAAGTTAPTTTAAPATTAPAEPATTVATTAAATTTPPTTTPPTTPPRPIAEGDVVALLELPSIGVSQYVVAGVGADDLRKGPGHYPDTPLPGQLGNVAIAGHRTTYGAPFYDVDRLAAGDEVVLTTPEGRFVYRVTESFVVSPSDYSVIGSTGADTVTLTSCHPRYSARERIIVRAAFDAGASSAPLAVATPNYLDAPAVPETTSTVAATTVPPTATSTATSAGSATTVAPSTTAAPPTTATTVPPDLGGSTSADALEQGWWDDTAAWPQVALWGAALVAVSLAAWRLSLRTRRNWVGALAGIVPFVVVLYFFFENVNRLLPPNL